MIIDAHQHFWKLSRGDYDFPRKDDPLLYRDFLPRDLKTHLSDADVVATIAVQATETVAETEFLLKLARDVSFISGVVGWCNLADGAMALAQLDAMSGTGPLVGIRPMLQARDDASWLLSEQTRPAIAAMAEMGLAFDALVDARHLAVIDALATKFPNLHIVVDHFGKPWRNPDLLEKWSAGMERLSRHPNCWFKLSGIPATEDARKELSATSLIRFAADTFGADRMILGSDWPVSNRHGPYSESLRIVWDEIAADARSMVFSDNATAAYRLPRQHRT